MPSSVGLMCIDVKLPAGGENVPLGILRKNGLFGTIKGPNLFELDWDPSGTN